MNINFKINVNADKISVLLKNAKILPHEVIIIHVFRGQIKRWSIEVIEKDKKRKKEIKREIKKIWKLLGI